MTGNATIGAALVGGCLLGRTQRLDGADDLTRVLDAVAEEEAETEEREQEDEAGAEEEEV